MFPKTWASSKLALESIIAKVGKKPAAANGCHDGTDEVNERRNRLKQRHFDSVFEELAEHEQEYIRKEIGKGWGAQARKTQIVNSMFELNENGKYVMVPRARNAVFKRAKLYQEAQEKKEKATGAHT